MPIRAFARTFVWLIVPFSMGAMACADEPQTLAFEGAEGFGAKTIGGRGGSRIVVTNLNDSGPGSLRAALTAKGPRIVTFDVAGIIELESELEVSEPFLTLDGSSAPDKGICLKNYGLSLMKTHDVIVRYIRIRLGDLAGEELDAFSAGNSQNIMIDHCSFSWGIDETLSIRKCEYVTAQWCIISEGLHDSVHPKGPHGFASLIDGDRITFHHNLYAHFDTRMPRPGTCLFDFRNNVIYNWGYVPGYNGDDATRMNYVGNYLKAGPSSQPKVLKDAFWIQGPANRVYAQGNVLHNGPQQSRDNWTMIRHVLENRVDEPFETAGVTTHSAEEAWELVLQQAGATLPLRDAVDQRVVQSVRDGTGRIIDSQKDVGGWPK